MIKQFCIDLFHTLVSYLLMGFAVMWLGGSLVFFIEGLIETILFLTVTEEKTFGNFIDLFGSYLVSGVFFMAIKPIYKESQRHWEMV